LGDAVTSLSICFSNSSRLPFSEVDSSYNGDGF
jgi:hypothetical protein